MDEFLTLFAEFVEFVFRTVVDLVNSLCRTVLCIN